jgi:mannose-6-phosphate isomerase-like protein (cupin superfamily)
MAMVPGAKDLRVIDPHPLDCELDGYAWLPRMLDKARATLAGTQGDYQFGCPVDHTCMAHLRVTPELILDLAGRFADDRDVLAALRARGIPSAHDAWFDGPAVEDELRTAGTYVRVRRPEQLVESAHGALFAGHDHGASVSVSLLSLAPGEGQSVHSHAIAEVLVVVRGKPTVFLGEHQARMLAEREVARVPAHAPHRIENHGAAPAECVIVHGTP